MREKDKEKEKEEVMVVSVGEMIRGWGVVRTWLDAGGEVFISVYKKPLYRIEVIREEKGGEGIAR